MLFLAKCSSHPLSRKLASLCSGWRSSQKMTAWAKIQGTNDHGVLMISHTIQLTSAQKVQDTSQEVGQKDCKCYRIRTSAMRLCLRNDRKATPKILQQYCCLNKIKTMTTLIGMKMWTGKMLKEFHS